MRQQEVYVNKDSRIAKVFCIRFLEITITCGNEFLSSAVIGIRE